jgi:hypothetical protein
LDCRIHAKTTVKQKYESGLQVLERDERIDWFFFVGFEGFCVCDNIGFDKLGFTVKRNAGSGSGFENHGQVVWPC